LTDAVSLVNQSCRCWGSQLAMLVANREIWDTHLFDSSVMLNLA
jgi:hypothetical protein